MEKKSHKGVKIAALVFLAVTIVVVVKFFVIGYWMGSKDADPEDAA